MTGSGIHVLKFAVWGIALQSGFADAQNYPSGPIRVIVPYPPGGGTDILSRSIAPKLHEAWGQPVVVENRGGANGNIGAAAVARAAPDGHTILIVPIGFAVNPSLYKDIPFDPARDLAPVSQLASNPSVLVVHPSFPPRTVKELIALLKARPNEINYARGEPMNEPLLEELLALQQRDVDTRSRLLGERRLYGAYDPEMQQVHRENAERLDALVTQHGWPGTPSVGLGGSRAAWLVAQHSICTPALQRKFCNLLEQAAEKGNAPRRQFALLTDRILFNEGKAQVYGTVLDWDGQGELSCSIRDPENVDARRLEVGLPPLAEELRTQREAARAEGAAPPADYEAYRRKSEEFARKVGWR